MITRPRHSASLPPSLNELLDWADAAEQELKALREQVTHLDRLATAGILAAGMAHEINNLLTPVLCYAQIATGRPDDAEAQRKAAVMANAGVSAAVRLAQANLAFASPATGHSSGSPGDCTASDSCCTVRAAVEDALNCLGNSLPEHNSATANAGAIEVDLREGVSCTIDVAPWLRAAIAPIALQQIVVNLLLNAMAALCHVEQPPGGERRIEINARAEPQGSITLRITDTGPGIPAGLRDRLFEPFVKGHCGGTAVGRQEPSRPSAPSRSSGLGLAICRMIAEQAGGEITVSSRPGRTTFAIRLRHEPKQKTN